MQALGAAALSTAGSLPRRGCGIRALGGREKSRRGEYCRVSGKENSRRGGGVIRARCRLRCPRPRCGAGRSRAR
jgi:hypothetical protein